MKVISFSLFGLDPMYTVGAISNTRLAAQHYPGWVCRFYLGDSISADVQAELERLGAQTVRMTGRREDWSALLWRYNTLTDKTVEAHQFRDCDSRLDAREAAAVAEWLRSGAQFHIMRDHPEHYLPILAGLWGCTTAGAARIANLRPSNLPSDHRFVDQVWLRETVYPIAGTNLMVHDEFNHFPGEPARPFPIPRLPLPGGGWAFAGQGYTAEGEPRYPDHAHQVEQRHEWRLFDEGTIPEYTTPEWYTGRDHAPHLEEIGHRRRMLATATFAAQAAFTDGLKTVVDLGSGDGGILTLLGPNLTAWGYDLMPANVEAAKERGVDVRYGDVLRDDIEWGDVAICTEMLEHLVDPHGFVRHIGQHSRALVCSSPQDERKGNAYEFHTWAWDLQGYRALVEQGGFRVIRQRTVDRFQVILAVRS